MKRFELWLTTAIMFSLPALVFAQPTGGSSGKLVEKGKGTGAGTGRKGTAQAEIRKKGSGNAPRTTGPLNPQPLPPRNPAPLAGNGSGNAPKTNGTATGDRPVGDHGGSGGGAGKVAGTESGNKPGGSHGGDTPTQMHPKKTPGPTGAKER